MKIKFEPAKRYIVRLVRVAAIAAVAGAIVSLLLGLLLRKFLNVDKEFVDQIRFVLSGAITVLLVQWDARNNPKLK